MSEERFREAMEMAERFSVPGRITSIEENTVGHINRTYILTADDGRKYTLQRINSAVFPHPEDVMQNIKAVTEHLAEKYASLPDGWRRALSLMRTEDGKCCSVAGDGMYWRMYRYIDNVETFSKVTDEDVAYNHGNAIGKFQKDLSDLDASSLKTVLPLFHDMKTRFSQLRKAVESASEERLERAAGELSFLFENEERGCRISRLYSEGRLPARITHNDTKVNNVLFSPSGEGLCVIDLDTVMPGTVLFDTGDMIRTACNTADEDEKDAEKVAFSLGQYRALRDGYLEASSSFLTDDESSLIKESGRTMTEIVAVRFLTDYLSGDVYFRTAYPEHNLVRARAQIALMKSMDSQWRNF